MVKRKDTNFEILSDIIKVLSNPIRLQIIHNLKQDGCHVSRIQKKLNLRQPNISQHLSLMRRMGILKARKEGVKTCYIVINNVVKNIIKILDLKSGNIKKSAESRSDVLKAISNTIRLKIIGGLIEDECNVNKIRKRYKLAQSTVSQHISLLRSLRIILPVRRGLLTCYRLSDPTVKKIAKLAGKV